MGRSRTIATDGRTAALESKSVLVYLDDPSEAAAFTPSRVLGEAISVLPKQSHRRTNQHECLARSTL